MNNQDFDLHPVFDGECFNLMLNDVHESDDILACDKEYFEYVEARKAEALLVQMEYDKNHE